MPTILLIAATLTGVLGLQRNSALVMKGARETVGVIGASGNVGKLVALRLSDSHDVRALVRDRRKVSSFLDRDNIELCEVDLADVSEEGTRRLEEALVGTSTIVCCTGTTAFPSVCSGAAPW